MRARRDLVVLWLGQALSALGDRLHEIALAWLATERLGAGAGWVLGAGALARLVVGPFGGLLADRIDRRALMIVCDLARAGLVLSLVLVASPSPAHLALVAAGVGACGALFDPTLRAALPVLAQGPALVRANALLDATQRVARFLGPWLAGVLLAVMPMTRLFAVDGATYLVSAGALLSIGAGRRWRATPARRLGTWAALVEGARLTAAHPLLPWSFAGMVAANLAWGVGFLVAAPLLVRAWGLAAGDYSWLVAAYGVGNLAGSAWVMARPPRHAARSIFLGIALFGAGLAALPFAPSLPVALACAALASFGAPLTDVPLATVIQTEVPAEAVGRVYALRLTLSNAGFALSLLLATRLLDALPLAWGAACLPLGCAAVGLAGLWRFRG